MGQLLVNYWSTMVDYWSTLGRLLVSYKPVFGLLLDVAAVIVVEELLWRQDPRIRGALLHSNVPVPLQGSDI